MRRSPLTRKQIELLRQRYADTEDDVLALQLGVRSSVVRCQAILLGLRKRRKNYRPMSTLLNRPDIDNVLEFIRTMYPDGRDAEITEKTGLRMKTVRRIAKRYGIYRSEEYLKTRKGRQRVKRTAEVEDIIRREYPATSSRVLAARLGISANYVSYIGRQIGVAPSVRNDTENK